MPRASAHNSDIDSCGLTYSELQELWLGPCNGSVFETPEELRAAWERGRAVVMRLWGSGGRRPQAWWAFDTELEYPGYDRERSYLYEHNVFSQQERDAAEAEWRREFDAAQGLDVAERRARYRHHDIPNTLVLRWSAAARRRRARQPVTLPATPVEEVAAKGPG